MTWVQCRDRNFLGVCVTVEDDLILVWGSINSVFMWAVEIDFVFVCVSNMTWFQRGHRNQLGFVWVVEKTDFRVGDRKSSDFSVGIGIDLVFVWMVEIDFVFVSGHRN